MFQSGPFDGNYWISFFQMKTLFRNYNDDDVLKGTDIDL